MIAPAVSSIAETPVKLVGNTLALNVGGLNIFFSRKEFMLVEMLFNAMGRGKGPVHQDNLINAIYFIEDEPEAAVNVLRVFIHRIRKKLCGTDVVIRNFREVGYSMVYSKDTEYSQPSSIVLSGFGTTWLRQGVRIWRVE